MSDSFDDLVAEARESATQADNGEWGYAVKLEPGDEFRGRWRGQDTSNGDYGEQPIYLLWDRDDKSCFMYGGKKVLDRKIEDAAPGVGDLIAIARIEDEFIESTGRTMHRYGVGSKPTDDPLPESDGEDW